MIFLSVVAVKFSMAVIGLAISLRGHNFDVTRYLNSLGRSVNSDEKQLAIALKEILEDPRNPYIQK